MNTLPSHIVYYQPTTSMKRSLLLLFVSLMTLGLSAQKFAYIDTKYILLHMPSYANAQQELNKLSSDWQEEIEKKYEAIDKLTRAYEAEKVLLTEDMKQRRMEEIEQKRQEAKEMQRQKFGANDGELFKKREDLLRPIQEEIYNALVDVAESGGYHGIFDKANQSNLLYTNPKYDLSDKILKKMGLTPGQTIEPEGGSKGGGKDENAGGGSKGGSDPGRGGNSGGGSKPGGGAPGGGGTNPRPGGGGMNPAGGANKPPR
jgi:outer membrane protein